MKPTALGLLSFLGTSQALKFTVVDCDETVTAGLIREILDTREFGRVGDGYGTEWQDDQVEVNNKELFGSNPGEFDAVKKAWKNYAALEDAPDDAIIPPMLPDDTTNSNPDGVVRNNGVVLTCKNAIEWRTSPNSGRQRPWIRYANIQVGTADVDKAAKCADPKAKGPANAITVGSWLIDYKKLEAKRQQWVNNGRQGEMPTVLSVKQDQESFPSVMQVCRFRTDAAYHNKADWRTSLPVIGPRGDQNLSSQLTESELSLTPRDNVGGKAFWNIWTSRFLKEDGGVTVLDKAVFDFWRGKNPSRSFVDITNAVTNSGSGITHHEMFHTVLGGDANADGTPEVYTWEDVSRKQPRNNAESRAMFSIAVFSRFHKKSIDRGNIGI